MEEGIMPDEVLVSKIYLLRGQKVMLDRDLAGLYGVMAIRLREQVSRNLDRFPVYFMFHLSENEVDLMVSQFAIPSRSHLGGSLPYAFTEHGVLMLANVLRSECAIKMSIRIIEVFVRIRETLQSNREIMVKLEELERIVTSHDNDIQRIFACLKELFQPSKNETRRIGFKWASED